MIQPHISFLLRVTAFAGATKAPAATIANRHIDHDNRGQNQTNEEVDIQEIPLNVIEIHDCWSQMVAAKLGDV